MPVRRLLGSLVAILLSAPLVASAEGTPPPARPARFVVTSGDTEPKRRVVPTEQEIESFRAATLADPRKRKPRLDLVRALLATERLAEARTEAERWREHDAYNLVAVRLLGDIESEMGDAAGARRTYSSIVELLPRDVEARRALATVLKQRGDLETARRELAAALELRPEDRRILFELGDVEQRLGLVADASKRFQETAGAADAEESLRYPAKQRLAQIFSGTRREALAAGNAEEAERAKKAIRELGIEGGVENDMKVFLSWDTDRTDVDLWVVTPSGEKVFYSHAQGAGGEALFHDVTTGYGPESFTAHRAARGEYRIAVNYYGARAGDFKEARGDVLVVLDEGRATEVRRTFPYRLFQQGDTVEVAHVSVGGAS